MDKILENIKLARKLRFMSQEQAAEKLNISLLSYSKIERGITELTVNRLNEIARIFETTIDDLLGIERSAESIQIFDNLNKRIRELEERVKDKESINFSYEFTVWHLLEGLGADIISFFAGEKSSRSISPLYKLEKETPYCSLIRNEETVSKITAYLNFITKESEFIQQFYLSELFSLNNLFDAMDNHNFVEFNKSNISIVVMEKLNADNDIFREERKKIKSSPNYQKRLESMRKFRDGNS
jgi:transcriptional regulator with XRE-family HTH domain